MSSPAKASKRTYSLQEVREDVRRLLTIQRRIAIDEFAFVFRMEYGYDIKPDWFGWTNLQQIFEKKMIDIVKIGGATHRDRFVELQQGAGIASQRTKMQRARPVATEEATASKKASGPSQRPQITSHAAASSSSSTSSKRQGSRQPAYTRSFIIQKPGEFRARHCYNVTTRPPAYPRASVGMHAHMQPARYPAPVFVAPTSTSSHRQPMTRAKFIASTGKRPDTSRLINELEARAKEFARDCVASGKHVDSSRICQAILRERNVNGFKDLGLRGHHEIPYIKELEMLQRRVYETVTAYCQVRATSTLYELGLYLAQLEGKENFDELCLGPLLEQPAVYQYFKPRRTLRGVPEITTKDVLEFLRSFMMKYDKWFSRIEMTEFMSFMAKERGCGDPYELCVRVPSLGLSISVLRKAQRAEKQEWRRIRDEIAQETTGHIERKLRTTMELLLGTGKQPSQRARIDEIAGQPANEVVQHVFMYLSHRDMFPADINEAMRRFFGYVSTNQFAGKLFKLAICKGTIEDPEQAPEEDAEDSEDNADETEKDEKNESSENEEPYDTEWDRKYHRQVVPEDDVAAEICKWLDQTDDLDLRTLAQIESKVADRFEAPKFTDLDHGSFLYFVTHNQVTASILEKSSLQSGASVSDKEQSAQALLKQAPRESVLDFLQQCGLTAQPISLSQAICDQFGVLRVEDLRLGSIERLIKRAHTHQNTSSIVLEGGHDFPRVAYQSALLCGSPQLESSHEIRAATPGGSGLLGWQSAQRAARLLLSCPFLGDLSKWSHWDEVFAPCHGSLKDFISSKAAATLPPSCTGVFALEVEPGVYLRVNPRCSREAYTEAVANGDSLTAAVQIIGLIIKSGSVGAFTLALAASYTRTALERLVAATDVTNEDESYADRHSGPAYHRHPAVQFILEMLLRIPYKLSVAISQQIFLEPLHDIVGAALAPRLLLECCKSDDEKTGLQKLGIAFNVSEWVQDFERRGQPPAASLIPTKLHIPETKAEAAGAKKEETTHEDSLETGNTSETVSPEVSPLEQTFVDEGELDAKKKEEDVLLISLHDESSDQQQLASTTSQQLRDGSSTQQDPSTDSDSAIESYAAVSDSAQSSVDADDENSSSDESDRVSVLEDETECKAVVDDILREEFGEGLELGPEEAKLVQKQRLREGRGLHRLSSELYSKDTHFVLELVQNADDNAYPNSDEPHFQPAVVFVVTKDCVTVLNNELGFQENHIRALCDVGRSTKGKHTKGYIGQKGIGFKSVFRITDTPEVHSGGYHIKFNAQSGPLGYIFPHWIPPQERSIYKHHLDDIEGADEARWTTKIILPLKPGLCGQVKSLAPRFHDVQPSLLLFLNRLRSITIVDKVNKTERYMNRRDLSKSLFEVHHSEGVEKWLVVRRELDASKMKEGIGYTEVAVGFPLPAEDILSLASPLQQNLPQQKVFAYLPLRSYGLRFIIQGDFEVPSSREAVDESSPWNQWLREQIAKLFVEDGLKHFKELDDMPTLDALCVFLRFVPLEAEVQGFFQPVTREIMKLLKGFKCMPVLTSNPASLTDSIAIDDDDEINWVQPSQAVIAKDSLLYDVLPVDMLKDHLDLHYLHPKVAGVLNPGLARCLGVEQLSSKHLLKSAETMCALHAQQPHSSQLSRSWIAKWLLCVSRAMIREFNTSNSLYDSLRKLTIVPLSNGNFVSLSDTTVFFPLEDGGRKSRFSAGKSYLDAIHNDMNTVSKDLLSMQSNADNASVHKLLDEMGVKRMSPREIVHSHIIPILESNDWRRKPPGLVVSYLVFVKEQLDRDPKVIKIDKLINCAVLLTNHGQLRPKEDIIHFSSIYLLERKFDLQRLFPEVSWKMVDQMYLQLCDASNPAQIHSWETFLRQLNVEQYLAVRERTVTIDEDELSASPWSHIAKIWPKAADGKYQILDFTCPEFLAVVGSSTTLDKSVQKQRMKCLVELFNHTWDLAYNGTTKAIVKNGSGDVVCETESTFYMELKRTLWMPAEVKYQQSTNSKTEPTVLHRPDTLFLNETKTKALLHCHVDYADSTITNKNFVKCLGLLSSEVVTVEFILELLRDWSGPPDAKKQFETSLGHMWSVYQYLLESSNVGDKQDRIRLFFQQERAFFVPFQAVYINRTAHEIVPGTFFTFDEVCWEDSTRVLCDIVRSAGESAVPGPKLLSEVYSCIGENNCRYLGKLFLDKLNLQKTPRVLSLLEVMEYVAGAELTPTSHVVRQIQKLYIAVSKVVRESAEKDAYETARKANSDLPSTLAKWKSENSDGEVEEFLLDEGIELNVSESQKALLVRAHTTGKTLFASDKDKWVSTNQRPMVNDNPNMAERFSDHPAVHFLWPILGARSSASSASSRTMPLGAEARQKRLQQLQSRREEDEKDKIHDFFAICGIKKLSKVVSEQVHEYGVCSCPQLQLQVQRLLPFIQRYMFSEVNQEYQQLQEEGLPERLMKMRFSIADQILVSLAITGLDVHSDEQETDCALSNREALIVSRQAWTSADNSKSNLPSLIGRELAKLFLRFDHAMYSRLESFIENLVQCISNKEELQKFVKLWGLISQVPEDERVWHIPAPTIAEEMPQQEQQEREQKLHRSYDASKDEIEKKTTKQPEDGKLRSWPPRSSTQPPSAKSQERSHQNNNEDTQEQKIEWKMPQQPEQWQGPDGQLPKSKADLYRDKMMPKAGHDRSDEETPHLQTRISSQYGESSNVSTTNMSAESRHRTPANQLQSSMLVSQQTLPQMDLPLGLFVQPTAMSPAPFVDMPQNQQMLHTLPPPFQPPFNPTTVSSIKFEEVARAPQLRPPMSVTLHSQSPQQDVGRYGEELIFLYLSQQKELGLLTYDDQPVQNVSVSWVNQTAESGYPFDIQIHFFLPTQQTPKYYFIEVKTTRSPDKGLFQISNNELRFAHQQRDAFYIYRVFNAGNAAVRVARVKNLSQYLDANQVQLYLEI